MHTLPLDQLIVPDNRQRRNFDEKAIAELANSIREKGLMHPVVVRDDGVTLVAGERRVRALRKLAESGASYSCDGVSIEPGHVCANRLGSLSPLELREAELEENTVRLDLTWQERSSAIAALHDLRSSQAEARGEIRTVRDTAQEILGRAGGYYSTNVTEALQLSKHLDDPEIASAKSAREALKLLDKKARVEHRQKLLAEFGEVPSEHTMIEGDAFEVLPTIKDEFDIIITDPPYGIGAENFGDMAAARHEYKDSPEFAVQCANLVFSHANLRCKASGFVFLFCDIRLFEVMRTIAHKALDESWKTWDTPLIWSKGNGMLPVPEKGPRRTYEAIFYAYRGNRQWVSSGSPDVIEVPTLSAPEFGAQKPVPLFEYLITRVSQPGDRILDPFAGTGPTLLAAQQCHCVATGIELNPQKIAYYRERVANNG